MEKTLHQIVLYFSVKTLIYLKLNNLLLKMLYTLQDLLFIYSHIRIMKNILYFLPTLKLKIVIADFSKSILSIISQ